MKEKERFFEEERARNQRIIEEMKEARENENELLQKQYISEVKPPLPCVPPPSGAPQRTQTTERT